MKLLSIYFFIISVSMFSCKKEKEPTPVLQECNNPSSVSYKEHIQPIFNTHCIKCHSTSHPDGGLILEETVSYAQLSKSGSGYLDTLSPQFSLLYVAMNSTSNPMPKSGRLDNCTIQLVLKWIEQKAKNN